MGGAASIPLEEIKRETEQVMTTFTPLYVKHYALALIAQMKAERSATPSQYMLQGPPVPSEPLRKGMLWKQGAVNKSWRHRFFVALNKADNFEIAYYVDEKAFDTNSEYRRGTIRPCWYRVVPVTDELEKKDLGEFAFKLVPWWTSDRRRTWVLRAEDAESQKQWMSTFEYAAWKADAPLNQDPVMRRAFQNAYRETRWKLDEWGWYYYAQTEEEQLALLCVDRCERTCMQSVYNALPAGQMYWTLRRQVQGALDSTVGVTVAAAWKAVAGTITASKDKIKETAEANIGVVLDKQVELQRKIADGIGAKLNPFVERVAGPVLSPLINVLTGPLASAFRELIQFFINHFKGAADKGEAEWKKALDHFDRETYWYWGDLYPVWRIVRYLTRYSPEAEAAGFRLSIPLDTIVSLLGGVELWQVERDYEDGLRDMARKAVYTLKQRTTTAEAPATPNYSKAALEAALADVTAVFIHDASIMGMDIMHGIFAPILMKPVNKDFIPTVQDVLSPLKALIPDVVKPLLDIDEMVETTITTVVDGVIESATGPGVDKAFRSLGDLAFGGVTVPLRGAESTAVVASPTSAGAGASSGAGAI